MTARCTTTLKYCSSWLRNVGWNSVLAQSILFFRSYIVLLSQQSELARRKQSLTESSCSEKSTQHNYTLSQKLGTDCYTAAEISADLVKQEYTIPLGDDKIYGGFRNVPLKPGDSYGFYLAVKVQLPVKNFYFM